MPPPLFVVTGENNTIQAYATGQYVIRGYSVVGTTIYDDLGNSTTVNEDGEFILTGSLPNGDESTFRSITAMNFTRNSTSVDVIIIPMITTLPTYPIVINGGGIGASATPNEQSDGEQVAIFAGQAPAGQVFNGWTTTDGIIFANAALATTTFTMIDQPVTVTATWRAADPTAHTVTVQGGVGASLYHQSCQAYYPTVYAL